jgi:hypothetical protein
MPVKVPCPSCATRLRGPDSAAGRGAVCPSCGYRFRLTGLEVYARIAAYRAELAALARENRLARDRGDLPGRLNTVDRFVLCLQRLKALQAAYPWAVAPRLVEEVAGVKRDMGELNRDLSAHSLVKCPHCGADQDRWRVPRCFHCLRLICPSCYGCACSRPVVGPAVPVTSEVLPYRAYPPWEYLTVWARGRGSKGGRGWAEFDDGVSGPGDGKDPGYDYDEGTDNYDRPRRHCWTGGRGAIDDEERESLHEVEPDPLLDDPCSGENTTPAEHQGRMPTPSRWHTIFQQNDELSVEKRKVLRRLFELLVSHEDRVGSCLDCSNISAETKSTAAADLRALRGWYADILIKGVDGNWEAVYRAEMRVFHTLWDAHIVVRSEAFAGPVPLAFEHLRLLRDLFGEVLFPVDVLKRIDNALRPP